MAGWFYCYRPEARHHGRQEAVEKATQLMAAGKQRNRKGPRTRYNLVAHPTSPPPVSPTS